VSANLLDPLGYGAAVPHDERKTEHKIGNRTYMVADVEPLDGDGLRTVQVGAGLWVISFLGLLPFYGSLDETGRIWWLWTCWAGFALGLFGYEWARRRRNRRQRRH
jgi:Protein of unknown function (DUF2530)